VLKAAITMLAFLSDLKIRISPNLEFTAARTKQRTAAIKKRIFNC